MADSTFAHDSATGIEPRGGWLRGAARRLKRAAPGLAGALLLVAFLIAAAAPGLLSSHAPDKQDILERLTPPAWSREGSREYLLGTDQLGRDMVARLAYGARVSLAVGALTVALSGPLGLAVGLVAGFYRGRTEMVSMAVVDILLATPFVLVAIVVAAAFGAGLWNVIGILAATGWVVFARLAHGRTLSLRQSEFVEAARALGAQDTWIFRRHIIPHLLAPFVVLSTLQFGRMMLAEAALSFVGLGVEPSRPTWGAMLGTGRSYIWTAPWLVTLPGLAITLTVLGANLLGNWFRHRLDPLER